MSQWEYDLQNASDSPIYGELEMDREQLENSEQLEADNKNKSDKEDY